MQIFCAPYSDFTPNTRKSQLLWNETIAAHVEKNGLMVFPALGDGNWFSVRDLAFRTSRANRLDGSVLILPMRVTIGPGLLERMTG